MKFIRPYHWLFCPNDMLALDKYTKFSLLKVESLFSTAHESTQRVFSLQFFCQFKGSFTLLEGSFSNENIARQSLLSVPLAPSRTGCIAIRMAWFNFRPSNLTRREMPNKA